MKININLEDYEDYDYLYEDEDYGRNKKSRKMKSLNKENNKKEGHQKKHGNKQDMWEKFMRQKEEEDFEFILPVVPKKEADKKPSPFKKDSNRSFEKKEKFFSPQTKSEITWGPNTHEIKGNKIDFDRIENVEKVENEFNGRRTFGIKFSFSGKKGLSRTIWFNQNERERDSVYNSEYAFWRQIKKK